jgi:hypothetical protein
MARSNVMNEIQFLRSQLQTEHRHLEAVLQVCTDAIANPPTQPDVHTFLQYCADYLLPAVKALVARDRARLALHYARAPTADQSKTPDAIKFESMLDTVSTQWAVIDPASTDLLPTLHRSTQALGQLLRARGAASTALDDSSYSVEQWRKVAFVDARSILDERSRYRRVEAALPLGIPGMERHGH